MSRLGGQGHLDPRTLEGRAPRWAGPWTFDHLVGLLAVDLVGLILVVLGWWQTAGLGSAHEQLLWLNVGVVGLVLAGGANGLWLARGRRVIVLARAAVLPHPPGTPAAPATSSVLLNGHATYPVHHRRISPRDTVSVSGDESTDGLVAGQGMSYYHRANCLLVAGKEVRIVGRLEHEVAGRRPCEVCHP